MKKRLLMLIFIVAVGLGVYGSIVYMETTPPEGEWAGSTKYLGAETLLKVTAADVGQGLAAIEVTFTQSGEGGEGSKVVTLLSEDLSTRQPPLKWATKEIPLNVRELGIKEGPGVVTVRVRDRSLWNLGKGNAASREYPVVIDTRPPTISVLSSDHSVVQGGAEVVVYRGSVDTITTGVRVGDHLFPGYSVGADDAPDNTYVALFSYPYDLSPNEPLFVESEDRAGNIFQKNLPVRVKAKAYRKRLIHVSDGFIERKIPEVMSSAGMERTGDPLSDFLAVNKDLRASNGETIRKITTDSSAEKMWKGGFVQTRNTKVEAKFADFRTYMYHGEEVDEQYHLGYDLAATRRYPVGAANTGRVALAEPLGIYGNTVIIDHGLGLFTLYAHLSSFNVAEGDRVKKGAIIGKTGDTGFAGGDHLHFSVFVDAVAVTPIEWWDAGWVRKRISRRLNTVLD